MPRGVVAASVVQQILQSDDVGGDGGDRFRGIGPGMRGAGQMHYDIGWKFGAGTRYGHIHLRDMEIFAADIWEASANPLGIPPDGDDIAPEIRFRILAHQYIDEEGADHAGRAGYRDGLAVQSGPVDGQGRAM